MDPRTYRFIAGLMIGAALSTYGDAPPSLALEPTPLAYCASPDAGPTIEGRAAYVLDVVAGASLYEKNAEAQLPLASLTKVMTIFTALQTLPREGTVVISKDALSADGDNGLTTGEEWRVKDLADFTLLESANDGARALMLAAAKALGMSEEMYIETMNRKARSLGLAETYFINETGLDESVGTAGAYGSARDIAKLISYVALTDPSLMERTVLPEWRFATLSGVVREAHNTSLLAASFVGSVASKTGYTDLAGGNMSFVFEPVAGRPVAVVVLGSSREGRTRDAYALATFAQSAVRRSIACQ